MERNSSPAAVQKWIAAVSAHSFIECGSHWENDYIGSSIAKACIEALARIQTAGTRSLRACFRSRAGCAPPTGSAGHAGAAADLELTFNIDHSVGAYRSHCEGRFPQTARTRIPRRIQMGAMT